MDLIHSSEYQLMLIQLFRISLDNQLFNTNGATCSKIVVPSQSICTINSHHLRHGLFDTNGAPNLFYNGQGDY